MTDLPCLPCMLVLPWEQRQDGFTRYRWEYGVRGKSYIVSRNVKIENGHGWTDGPGTIWYVPPAMTMERRELHVHHAPVHGLLIAWESDKRPKLADLARFVCADEEY